MHPWYCLWFSMISTSTVYHISYAKSLPVLMPSYVFKNSFYICEYHIHVLYITSYLINIHSIYFKKIICFVASGEEDWPIKNSCWRRILCPLNMPCMSTTSAKDCHRLRWNNTNKKLSMIINYGWLCRR